MHRAVCPIGEELVLDPQVLQKPARVVRGLVIPEAAWVVRQLMDDLGESLLPLAGKGAEQLPRSRGQNRLVGFRRHVSARRLVCGAAGTSCRHPSRPCGASSLSAGPASAASSGADTR